MRQTADKLIGEHTYRVTQAPLSEAQPMIPAVLRCLGPSLAAALEGNGSVSELLESGVSLTKAVREFCLSISAHDLDALVNGLAKHSQVETVPGIFVPLASVMQNHFPPRYQEYLGWLAFALEVNFKSFFGGLQNVETALAGLRKVSASGSPKDSTGNAGAS